MFTSSSSSQHVSINGAFESFWAKLCSEGSRNNADLPAPQQLTNIKHGSFESKFYATAACPFCQWYISKRGLCRNLFPQVQGSSILSPHNCWMQLFNSSNSWIRMAQYDQLIPTHEPPGHRTLIACGAAHTMNVGIHAVRTIQLDNPIHGGKVDTWKNGRKKRKGGTFGCFQKLGYPKMDGL